MALSVLYEEDLGEWTLSLKSETKGHNFWLVIKCSVRFIKNVKNEFDVDIDIANQEDLE